MTLLPRQPEPESEGLQVVGKWRKDKRALAKFQFMHHFLPHPHHKKRAKLLSNHALFTYLTAVLFIYGFLNVVPKFLPGILGYAADIRVYELLTFTNQEREEASLPPLKTNRALTEAAKQKARDMFDKDYWAHVSPEGVEPWDFILDERYDYSYAGENLAKNFQTSKEVVTAWYASPSHRDNLLGENYDEVGFAVVDGVLDGYETTLVVQMFGKKRSSAYLASANPTSPLVEEEPAEVEMMVEVPEALPSENQVVAPLEGVQGAVDVSRVPRYLGLMIGGFLITLLSLDIWYSKRTGVLKLTGNTFAHLSFLVLAVLGMWFVLTPGKIL